MYVLIQLQIMSDIECVVIVFFTVVCDTSQLNISVWETDIIMKHATC